MYKVYVNNKLRYTLPSFTQFMNCIDSFESQDKYKIVKDEEFTVWLESI